MKKMSVIFIILIVILLAMFYFKKRSITHNFKDNLKYIDTIFGEKIAKNVERIYRLETNHFKSGQFKATFSPGMEKFGETYPYGWKTMASIFWDKFSLYRPVGFWTGTEGGTGKQKTFLKFPTLKAGMLTLAFFLKKYGNNPGRWYSTDLNSQQRYNKSISFIKTPIYDSIT